MKKVLIITYYWPPAGGPGVQRWLKFVKYLKDFNIEPVVYAPQNPTYPITDESFLEEIPADLTIIKQPIFEPYGFASVFSKKKTKTISKGIISAKSQSPIEKLLLWIRGNFFIPDARRFWIKPSVKFLSDYLTKEKINTVITTGPPHSLHLIGLRLKRQLNIQWIADFRDPWTTIGYHNKLRLKKTSMAKHKILEGEVLNSADKIITTSFTTKNEFYYITEKPIKVITNGYDVEDIEKVPLSREFTISHIGSLLSGRNPNILWQALAKIVKENEDFAKNFKLQLAGVVSKDVLKSIYNYGLKEYVEISGYLSHKDSLKLQRSSQVLLLIEINAEETKCIIPGKLFEYMSAERPIIAVGPENWDAEKIITETNIGKCFAYDKKGELKKYILSLYKNYKEDNLRVNPIGLKKYSRKSLTEELSKFILSD
ncbi:glycosyltransferase family 4 protein [Abyssalbus ytuae]|uniref:Glycosyltransferase family 4 protein n=1 Tax=Abyssalbus ytuae TaxID=2926907 RepID=A0A9E6ZN31_9FLAO|nr:glycosyltransferase family 4 protein [Abyssalbus ytuae]UOB17375.1 glycosyltransferase family 4 protein [Abyssalbus ytuae]